MSDWKEKYLKLAEQQHADSERSQETEQMLCRAIVRLTIATSGLDTNLDPFLKRLQKAAKGDSSSPEFKRHLSELSDELVRAGDARTQAASIDLFQRLLDGCGADNQSLAQLTALYERLAKEPGKASKDELDQLVRLLMASHPAAPKETIQDKAADRERNGGGLLGRLVAGKRETTDSLAEEAPSGPSPNEILRELLRRLHWPSQLEADIRQLRERLEAEKEQKSAWAKVVEDLANLLSSSLEKVTIDLHETESFLSSLNSRLQELDAVFQRMDLSRQESMESGRQLRASVGAEVGGVSHEVSTATDLAAFKSAVKRRLDTIQAQVEKHFAEEQERHRLSERDGQEMRERMKALEEEGKKLRSKLEEIQLLAVTDPLTELPNRLAFEHRAEEELARWKRFGEPLSLLIWDIDHFKRINDTFGHQAGDKALKVIGQTIASRLRKTDFVARVGGEEFVMLMPGTHADQVGLVADEIRAAVENRAFHSGQRRIQITISCGFTELKSGDLISDAYQRADAALYKAKEAGRNCCVRG